MDEFDHLDNMDDFDLEGFSDTESPNGDRNPVTSIARSAGSDLVNSFNEFNRNDTIRELGSGIFGQMSVDPGKSNTFVSGITDLNRIAVNTIKKEGSFIGDAAEDLLPDDGVMGSIKETLVDFFREREDSSTTDIDYDAMAASAVEAALGAKPQMSAEERIKSTRESMVNLDNNKLLASINTEMIHARKTTSDVHAKFLRASLAVQFKHLYVAKESLEIQKTYVAGTRDQLEGLIKNTGLPDFLKIAPTEMIAQQAMQRLSGGLLNAINASGSNQFAAIGDRLKDTLGEKLGVASELDGMRSMAGGISMKDMVSMSIVDGTKRYTGSKAGKLLNKTQWGRNLVDKYDDFLSDKSGFLRDRATGDGIKDKMFNFLADTLDIESNDYGGTVGKIEDRDSATQFTSEVKTSIVRVIPSLLSKILSVVSKQDEIQYDYNRGVFINVPTNTGDRLEEVFASNDAVVNNVRRANHLVDRLVASTEINVSPELRAKLIEAILTALNTGNRLTINNLADNLELSSFTETERSAVINLISTMKDKGTEQGNFKSNNRDYVANAFENMQANRQDPTGWIEEQIRRGNTGMLVSDGLIRYDGDGGYSIVKSKVDGMSVKASRGIYSDLQRDITNNPDRYEEDINDREYANKDELVDRIDNFLVKLVPNRLSRAISKLKTRATEISQMDREQLREAFNEMRDNVVANYESARQSGLDYKEQANSTFREFRRGYLEAARQAGLSEDDLNFNGKSLKFNYEYAVSQGRSGVEALSDRLNERIEREITSGSRAGNALASARDRLGSARESMGEGMNAVQSVFNQGVGTANSMQGRFVETFNPSAAATGDFAQHAYGGYVDPVAAGNRFAQQAETYSLTDLNKIIVNSKSTIADIKETLEGDDVLMDADRADYLATARTVITTVSSAIQKSHRSGRLSFREHGVLMGELAGMTATIAGITVTAKRKNQGNSGAAINIAPTSVGENRVIETSRRSITKVTKLFDKLNLILSDTGLTDPQSDIDGITNDILTVLQEHNSMIDDHVKSGHIGEDSAELLKRTLSNHIATSRLEGTRKRGVLGSTVTGENIKESLIDKALAKEIELELSNTITSKERENKLLNIIASQITSDDKVRAGSWLNQYQNNRTNQVDENGAVIQVNQPASTGEGRSSGNGLMAKLGMAAVGTMLLSSFASADEMGDISDIINKASEVDEDGYSTLGQMGKGVMSGISGALQFEGFDEWNSFIDDSFGSKEAPEGKTMMDDILIAGASGMAKYGAMIGGGLVLAKAARSLIGLAGNVLVWSTGKILSMTGKALWSTTKFLAGNGKYNPLAWLGRTILKGFGKISYASTKALIGATISGTFGVVKGLFGANSKGASLPKGPSLLKIGKFISNNKGKLIFGGALAGGVAANASEADTFDSDLASMSSDLTETVSESDSNLAEYITVATLAAAAAGAGGLDLLNDLDGDGKKKGRGRGKFGKAKGWWDKTKSFVGKRGAVLAGGASKFLGLAGLAYGAGTGAYDAYNLNDEIGVGKLEALGLVLNGATSGLLEDYLKSDRILAHEKAKADGTLPSAKADTSTPTPTKDTKIAELVTATPPKQEKKLSPTEAITAALIEKISVGEGTKGPEGFKTIYGHGKFRTCKHDLSGIEITDLTISELYDYMAKYSDNVRCYNRTHNKHYAISHAAGKLQFMSKTIQWVMKTAKGVTTSSKFTPSTQLKLGHRLLELQCRYSSWLNGSISDDEFLAKLSRAWASIPNPATGASSYNNKGKRYPKHGGTPQPSHSLSEWREFLKEVKHAPPSQLDTVTKSMVESPKAKSTAGTDKATPEFKGVDEKTSSKEKKTEGYMLGKGIGASISALFGFSKGKESSSSESLAVKNVPTKKQSEVARVDTKIENFSKDTEKVSSVTTIVKGNMKFNMIVIDATNTQWGVNLPLNVLTSALKYKKGTTTQPYHFVINADGTITTLVSLDSITGLHTKRGGVGGIEIGLVGGLNLTNETTIGPPTVKQLNALMELVKQLAKLYSLPREAIIGANLLAQDNFTGVFPTQSFIEELRVGKWRVSKETAGQAESDTVKTNKGTTASSTSNAMVRDFAPTATDSTPVAGETKSNVPIITVAQDPTTQKLASTMEASFDHTRTSNERVADSIDNLLKYLKENGERPATTNTGGENPTTRGGTQVADMVPTN